MVVVAVDDPKRVLGSTSVPRHGGGRLLQAQQGGVGCRVTSLRESGGTGSVRLYERRFATEVLMNFATIPLINHVIMLYGKFVSILPWTAYGLGENNDYVHVHRALGQLC